MSPICPLKINTTIIKDTNKKDEIINTTRVGVSGICLKKTENVGTLKLFKKLSGANEKGSEILAYPLPIENSVV